MNSRPIPRAIFLLLLALTLRVFPAETGGRPPNVVLIFADDLGFGDLGCYGARGYSTPNLDRLAKQGTRLTGFCVPQAVCSASRAALLTGCYPNRVGILGALGPNSKTGINASETTLAELLKSRGYSTAIFGKWHLGDSREFLPLQHGFDEYYGLPYSNDMWPWHPTGKYPDLPLIEGNNIVAKNPDQSKLTREYTDRAIRFVEANRNRPFFLYLPHSMPHVPLFAGADFKGRTKRGLFGDVLSEIDDSVGRILRKLHDLNLEENTIVIFTSDNGPWLSYGDHAGSAGHFREGKGTTFEGGVRVPCIIRWPGRIPAGKTLKDLASTIDIFPTIAEASGAAISMDRTIDGQSLLPWLSGKRGSKSPREHLFYYWDRQLQAIRSGPWKLHFPHDYVKPVPPGNGGKPGNIQRPKIEMALYNLEKDPGETRNVAGKNPEIVIRLQELARLCREDLGDASPAAQGKGIRPPGVRK